MSSLLATTLTEIQGYHQELEELLIYGDSFQDSIGRAFRHLLVGLSSQPPGPVSSLYASWFQALAETGEPWQNYVIEQVLLADNPFTRQVQRQGLEKLPAALVEAVCGDLTRLQSLYHLDPQQVATWVARVGELPRVPVVWRVSSPSPTAFSFSADLAWLESLPALAHHYRCHGVGVLARYGALGWQGGQLRGMAHPDPIRLEQLAAYDRPRQLLIQNTEALLRGYSALNVLLYGSRGTGKSSLVKALLNQYRHQGLRLVEVPKADLPHLPDILEVLRPAPQKFIIFVDDLSFEEDDDGFKALKVVLEGGVTARPDHVVVYATSNRRHLVREYFSDRPRPSDQEEVQAWDTVQEKLSFSDRFGLTLTFEPPDQPTYLAIVHHLAEQAGLPLEREQLEAQALRWATQHNGRSGRSARQFIDWLRAQGAIAGPHP